MLPPRTQTGSSPGASVKLMQCRLVLLWVCLVVALAAAHSTEARRRGRANFGAQDDDDMEPGDGGGGGGGGAEGYPTDRTWWRWRRRGRGVFESSKDVDSTDKLLNLETQMEERDLHNDKKRTNKYSPQRRRVIAMLSSIFQSPAGRRELYDWHTTRWLLGKRALIITRRMGMDSPADRHKINRLPTLPKCLSLVVNRRWEHYSDVSFPWGCCYMDVFGLIERCRSKSDPGSATTTTTTTTKSPNGGGSLSTTWRPKPASSTTKPSRLSSTSKKPTKSRSTKRARYTSTTRRGVIAAATTTTTTMVPTTLSTADSTTTSGPDAEPTSPPPGPDYEDLTFETN